jgi:hypothetical protein
MSSRAAPPLARNAPIVVIGQTYGQSSASSSRISSSLAEVSPVCRDDEEQSGTR